VDFEVEQKLAELEARLMEEMDELWDHEEPFVPEAAAAFAHPWQVTKTAETADSITVRVSPGGWKRNEWDAVESAETNLTIAKADLPGYMRVNLPAYNIDEPGATMTVTYQAGTSAAADLDNTERVLAKIDAAGTITQIWTGGWLDDTRTLPDSAMFEPETQGLERATELSGLWRLYGCTGADLDTFLVWEDDNDIPTLKFRSFADLFDDEGYEIGSTLGNWHANLNHGGFLGPGFADHGDLNGLLDDDHTQYWKKGGAYGRNYGLSIGVGESDEGAAIAIDLYNRQLDDSGGDATVDWEDRKLTHGAWEVSDETDITPGTDASGALRVKGGLSVYKNAQADGYYVGANQVVGGRQPAIDDAPEDATEAHNVTGSDTVDQTTLEGALNTLGQKVNAVAGALNLVIATMRPTGHGLIAAS